MEKNTRSKSPKQQKLSDDELVVQFMTKLEHPLKNEIEALRKIIKHANQNLSERIKWAAPSYYYKVDLLTFNLRSLSKVHLVFHDIAITKVESDLLLGEYKDRRMMYFDNIADIISKQRELERILNQYVDAID